MIVELLNFVGNWLYLLSGLLFLYLYYRTSHVKDGLGLTFLRVLTISLAIGSMIIFIIRLLSSYEIITLLTARAIAIVNPILLLSVGLYLNYLIHESKIKTESTDSKNITEIKKDVKEVKVDVKNIKDKV